MDGNGGSGVACETELLTFVDAALDAGDNLALARQRVAARLGEKSVVDAAAVIAGFDAITRVADGSGIPLEPPKAEATAEWRASLGIDDYWRNKV